MRIENTVSDPWRIAVDWFWLSHDDQSGKALLSPVHTGLGLGAALLAELLITNHVTIKDELIVATARKPPPDVLAHQVFSLVLGEPQPLPVRMWLSYLSRTARDDVGQHLERAALVRSKRSRLRRTIRWVPVDVNEAGRPESRLYELLDGNRGWTVNDAILGGLAEVTGLLGGVLETSEARTAHDSIQIVTGRLHPMMRRLLIDTRAAVSAAVLSERR